MADFELEQLKTLLDNLADGLDETSGDEGTHAELDQIKQILRKLTDHIIKDNSPGKTASDQKALVKNFFEEWDRNNPLRDLRKSVDDLNKKSDNPLRQGGGGGSKKPPKDGKEEDDSNPLMQKANDMAMSKLGGKFKIFSAALETAGAAAGGAVGWIKNQAEAYRTFLSTAEGSVSTMMEMKETAAKNDMSVQSLNNAMQMESLRAMGAKNFAKLDNTVRKTTLSLGQLGMNEEQRQKALDSFMGTLRDSGMWKTQNTEEQSRSFVKLIGLNEKMASIAGATRDEQLEKMKEQGSDAAFETWMRTNVKNPDDMIAMKQFLGNRTPEEAKAIKEAVVLQGGLLQDGAKLVAMTGEHGQNLMTWASQMRDGSFNADDAVRGQDSLHNSAMGLDKNVGLSTMMPIMAYQGDETALAVAGLTQSAFKQKDSSDVKASILDPKKHDPMENFMMNFQDMQDTLAAGLDDNLNQVLKPIFGRFGGALESTQLKVFDFGNYLHHLARKLEANPGVAEGLGYGAAAIAGTVGVLSTLATGQGIKSLFKLGGRGAAVGATEAGAAAEAGVAAEAGAAGAAGGLLLPVAGMAVGGAGMYYGYNKLAEGGDSKTDKALGYGSSIAGGAAAGAGIGALFGGVGAVPGALIGGGIGLASAAYSDWTHPDIPDATGIKGQKPSSNAVGKHSDPMADMVLLDAKMYEMQTKMWNTMIDIKKYNFQQLEVMREDLVSQKTATDRIARLLEESNRYTKLIGGLT